MVELASRSPEEATSRGSDSKDLKEEAEETRAELTDVEDRNEAGAWQGLNLNRMRIPAFSFIFWDGCDKNWHRHRLMTVPRETRGGGRRTELDGNR